mmetsp:Transcript_24802/g.63235  ORF Transcript_24802/g.63235 Transcript_24802/m.63235 type:complete len:581 (+) Transcript_24802:100-1842(+)
MNSPKSDQHSHPFSIRMADFSAEDLKTSGPRCDPYLTLNFDEIKKYQSHHETDTRSPEWGFKASFKYRIRRVQSLANRYFTIQCHNKHTGEAKQGQKPPHLIGVARVDLLTVATGPSSFRLTLSGQDGGPAGTISFKCLMRMVNPDVLVTLHSVCLTMLGSPAPAKLRIDPPVEDSSLELEHSQTGTWPATRELRFPASLTMLLASDEGGEEACLSVKVLEEDDILQGEAEIHFRDIVLRAECLSCEPVSVRCDVTYPESGKVGELTGTVACSNLPGLAQMIGGVTVDGGRVEGDAKLLAPGLLLPPCKFDTPPEVYFLPGETGENPTPVNPRSPEGSQPIDIPAELNNESTILLAPAAAAGTVNPQSTDNNSSSNNAQLEAGLGDLSFDDVWARHGPSMHNIELPLHWEMRRSKFGGNVFCHIKSKKTTRTDPRFLPDNWDQRIHPSTSRVYYQYHKTRQTTFEDPRGHPPGWELRVSSSGTLYYVFLPTRQATYSDPRGLPANYRAAVDPCGRVYYINDAERTTTWEDPRAGHDQASRIRWRQEGFDAWLRTQIALAQDKDRQDEERAQARETEEDTK